jgi:2-polyprenyl-6-methoxyphenol hydroxylase-like FAD-dependent oxidoreductase
MSAERSVDCCIAGGGPAGMMSGLLFARAGLKTLVLEKHADFLRDFRGDTVHPSTLELFHEIGLLDAFLERPHDEMPRLAVRFNGKRIEVADFSELHTRCHFIAFMPQSEFLDFVADEAAKLPNFELMRSTQANGLIEEGGAVTGLRAAGPDGEVVVRSRLVVGADGRHSTIRGLAGLKVRDLGAPIDVLWFSIPREGGRDDSLINVSPGHLVVTIDRGSYWQCACVIAKGELEAVKARGLERFRATIAAAAPHVAAGLPALESWDQVKLLSVTVDRLDEWSRPGLLCIGDAAHAMSPIGGVGINLAIQDAVAATNILAPKLLAGALAPSDLDAIRLRRLWPTRVTQFAQVEAQNRFLAPLIGGAEHARPPLLLRLVARFPFLRRLAARVVGLGVRPEHVRSSGQAQRTRA